MDILSQVTQQMYAALLVILPVVAVIFTLKMVGLIIISTRPGHREPLERQGTGGASDRVEYNTARDPWMATLLALTALLLLFVLTYPLL